MPVPASADYLVICSGLPDDGLGTMWTGLSATHEGAIAMQDHCASQGGEWGTIPLPPDQP